jgi:hypothetical protein
MRLSFKDSPSRMDAYSTKEKKPVDAFRELLSGQYEETRGIPWSITNLSRDKTFVSNGLQYCFVEVTFANGIQYGTEAYGEDAPALYTEASSRIGEGYVRSLGQMEPMLIRA